QRNPAAVRAPRPRMTRRARDVGAFEDAPPALDARLLAVLRLHVGVARPVDERLDARGGVIVETGATHQRLARLLSIDRDGRTLSLPSDRCGPRDRTGERRRLPRADVRAHP